MNFILWIIVGGIIGWIAIIIMRTNAQQGLMLNVLVGIIGALLAGFLLTPLFGGWHHQSKQLQLSFFTINATGLTKLQILTTVF